MRSVIIHSPGITRPHDQAVAIHNGTVQGMSYHPEVCSPGEAHFHAELLLVQYVCRSDR